MDWTRRPADGRRLCDTETLEAGDVRRRDAARPAAGARSQEGSRAPEARSGTSRCLPPPPSPSAGRNGGLSGRAAGRPPLAAAWWTIPSLPTEETHQAQGLQGGRPAGGERRSAQAVACGQGARDRGDQ